MDRIDKPPRRLSFKAINTLAQKFLTEHNCLNNVPIPIEKIALELDLIIIPASDLQSINGMEAFIIPQKKEIYIDRKIHDHQSPNRYNSTLAHEIAHFILHEEYMHEFKSEEDHVNFLTNFNEEWLDWIEWQAWNFARLTLLPSNTFPQAYEQLIIRHGAKIGNFKVIEKEAPDLIADKFAPGLSIIFEVSKDLAKIRTLNYLHHRI